MAQNATIRPMRKTKNTILLTMLVFYSILTGKSKEKMP